MAENTTPSETGPLAANLGDGANGRLSEAERDELRDAGLGRKFRMNALQMQIVERIVREHAERAWDEGVAWTGLNVTFAKTSNPYRRAARQEQGR